MNHVRGAQSTKTGKDGAATKHNNVEVEQIRPFTLLLHPCFARETNMSCDFCPAMNIDYMSLQPPDTLQVFALHAIVTLKKSSQGCPRVFGPASVKFDHRQNHSGVKSIPTTLMVQHHFYSNHSPGLISTDESFDPLREAPQEWCPGQTRP